MLKSSFLDRKFCKNSFCRKNRRHLKKKPLNSNFVVAADIFFSLFLFMAMAFESKWKMFVYVNNISLFKCIEVKNVNCESPIIKFGLFARIFNEKDEM